MDFTDGVHFMAAEKQSPYHIYIYVVRVRVRAQDGERERERGDQNCG